MRTSFVLSSALAPEDKLRFSATESLLQQLLPQDEGLNPQWYTAGLKILPGGRGNMGGQLGTGSGTL